MTQDGPFEGIEGAQSFDSLEDVDEFVKALHTGVEDHALQDQRYGFGNIAKSEPLMPTEEALSNIRTVALGSAVEKSPQGSFGDTGFENTVAALKDAVNHSDIVRSRATTIQFGQNQTVMPADVRDIPNRLYWSVDHQKNYHPVRAKADKLLYAIFGQDLGESVLLAMSRKGFHKDPLVGASQALWWDRHNDESHTFDYKPMPFNPKYDDNPNSPVLESLRMCFDAFTIKGLQKEARFHNQSVISIIRAIFRDMVTEMNITIPPPKDKIKPNPVIQVA